MSPEPQVGSILIGDEPDLDHKQTAYIYVLTNEERLVDSGLSTKEKNLKNVALFYQFLPTPTKK